LGGILEERDIDLMEGIGYGDGEFSYSSVTLFFHGTSKNYFTF
jgi:hypothetical protein